MKATVEGTSLEAVCKDSEGMVSSNALREQLTQALEEMTLREHEMNAALASATRIDKIDLLSHHHVGRLHRTVTRKCRQSDEIRLIIQSADGLKLCIIMRVYGQRRHMIQRRSALKFR